MTQTPLSTASRRLAALRTTALATALTCALVASPQVKTWTTTADFDEGFYLRTVGDNDEVKLVPTGTTAFPFLNVPQGGSGPQLNRLMIRINTRTGKVVGCYRMVPEGQASSTSRLSVDGAGNAWMVNQYGGGINSVTRIGIIIGGDRYRKEGSQYVLDPAGEYVKDWDYTTGIDRDGDGYIRTSRGFINDNPATPNVLRWQATTSGDLRTRQPSDPALVTEAEDELITIFRQEQCNRAIAVDGNGDAWLSQLNVPTHVKVSGLDGARIDARNLAGPGYYSYVDDNGRYWCTGFDGTFRHDLATNTSISLGFRTSTMAPAPDGTLVMHDSFSRVYRYSRATAAQVASYTVTGLVNGPGGGTMRGVGVTPNNHIWIAAIGSNGVVHLDANGNQLKFIPTGINPRSIGVDADGFVWVTHAGATFVKRINPALDGGKGEVDQTIQTGDTSYNYSDGTGTFTAQTFLNGSWNAVYTACRNAVDWARVSWNADVPADSELKVFLRAADTMAALGSAPFVEVTNGQNIKPTPIDGRYIEARVTFRRLTSQAATPILFDLTVEADPYPVRIEIEPGKDPNRVFLNRDYTLYVIAYGSAELNVDEIVPASVRFGFTGFEAPPVRPGLKRDWDGDGFDDLLFGFKTQLCGFQLGDTAAFLTFDTLCSGARVPHVGKGPIQTLFGASPMGRQQGDDR